MGYHYETAAEARERAKLRKGMTKEAYAAYEAREHAKFKANPDNRRKEKGR
jgi:hypothetical protein